MYLIYQTLSSDSLPYIYMSSPLSIQYFLPPLSLFDWSQGERPLSAVVVKSVFWGGGGNGLTSESPEGRH